MPLTKKLSIDHSKPVLVTGATGYVAGELIRQLLHEDGVTVHATVRDPSQKQRLQYLYDLPGASERLKLFAANLLQPGSFEKAIQGCAVVFHTASPFFFSNSMKDPYAALVEPAVRGTENVLRQAAQTPTVTRVVVTSSIAAIATDACDTLNAPHQVLTEEVWNRTASLTHNPYALSKTLAEQKAWEIAGGQTQFTLVTINPSMVLGPGLQYSSTSESYQTLQKLGAGGMELWLGTPEVPIPCVDIRTVAEAHRAAAFLPHAKGRYIVSASHHETSLSLARILAQRQYSETVDYPIAQGSTYVPKFLMWLLVPLVPSTGINRQFVANNFHYQFDFDTSKSQEELGLEYVPIAPGIQDMFQQIVDAGVVGPKPWYFRLVHG